MKEIDMLLETLISYFETGNAETDGVAKLILQSDPDSADYWHTKICSYQKSLEWTGIRAPEAEMLASHLRQIKSCLQNIRSTGG